MSCIFFQVCWEAGTSGTRDSVDRWHSLKGTAVYFSNNWFTSGTKTWINASFLPFFIVFRKCVKSLSKTFGNITRIIILSWSAFTPWLHLYLDTLLENRQEWFVRNGKSQHHFTQKSGLQLLIWTGQRATFNMYGEECVGEWRVPYSLKASQVSQWTLKMCSNVVSRDVLRIAPPAGRC